MKKTLLTLTALGMGLSMSAQAAVIVGDTADAAVDSSGIIAGSDTSSNFYAKSAFGAGGEEDAIFVFALPERLAGFEVDTTTSNFKTNFMSETGSVNVDLFGIGSRAASTVLGSDFGAGSLLQADYVSNGDLPGDYNTTVAGSAALGSWLDGLYDSGAVAGDFVFLRVASNDSNVTSSYRFRSANNGASLQPNLSIDFVAVPEPGTYALLAGLVGFAFVAIRRRK